MSLEIVLSSHGLFAQEALQTAEMIIGVPQKNVHVVSVTKGRTYEECLAEAEHIVKELDGEILYLTDIFGGTPANIATYLTLTHENIQVFSGFNIPLLLEVFLTNPDSNLQAKELIENCYSQALVDITEQAKGGNEDGDSMDSY